MPDTVSNLLKHIDCSSISDMILKLISVEELPDGAGTIKWLSEEGLIPHLFEQLDPTLSPDMHSNAAQILMDIISISFQQQTVDSMGSPLPEHINVYSRNELMDAMKR